MLPAGTRIGPYEIQAFLGGGGMALVYRARDVAMGAQVALKVLLPNYAHNPRVRERFQYEARLQFEFSHPNIVRAFGFHEEGEFVAVPMDLVRGCTLADLVSSAHGTLTPGEIWDRLLRPVVSAVAYAHAYRSELAPQGVIHRDLKPANILVDRSTGDGAVGVPKLADFGIAKFVAGGPGLTKTGAMMGTVPYMAPEQYRGARDVDTRADVYALGMMAWELFAGRLPLDPDNHLATLQVYAGAASLPPLETAVPSLGGPVVDVVAAALAHDPAVRPVDAGAFLAAMDAAFDGEGTAPSLSAPPIHEIAAARHSQTQPTLADANESHRPFSEAGLPQRPQRVESDSDNATDTTPGPSRGWGRITWLAGLLALPVLAWLAWVIWPPGQGPAAPPATAGPKVVVPNTDPAAAPPSEAPPAAVPELPRLRFDPDLWRMGNVWVYQVTRTAAEGKTDEGATFSFLLRREVVRNEAHPLGRLVEVKDTGGYVRPEPSRLLVVGEHCVALPTGATAFCLDGTANDLKPTDGPFGTWSTVEVRDEGTVARFDPGQGLLRDSRVDEQGRTTHRELVGIDIARGGERVREGNHSAKPVACDWDVRKAESDRVLNPQVGATDHTRAGLGFGLKAPLRLRTLKLAGKQGAVRFRAVRDAVATVSYFEQPGRPPVAWFIDRPVVDVKAWDNPDGSAEWVAAVYESDADVVYALFSLKGGVATVSAWTIPKVSGKATFVVALLIAAGDKCGFQVRRDVEGESLAHTLALAGSELSHAGGTLPVAVRSLSAVTVGVVQLENTSSDDLTFTMSADAEPVRTVTVAAGKTVHLWLPVGGWKYKANYGYGEEEGEVMSSAGPEIIHAVHCYTHEGITCGTQMYDGSK